VGIEIEIERPTNNVVPVAAVETIPEEEAAVCGGGAVEAVEADAVGVDRPVEVVEDVPPRTLNNEGVERPTRRETNPSETDDHAEGLNHQHDDDLD